LGKQNGIDFVRCRICRDRLRVISGRHLSKHGTDRETYREEYGLTPDELIAKDFRVIQSSRPGYFPHGKSDWIVAIKWVYKKDRNINPKHLQKKYPHLYDQGVWIFGDADKALRAAEFDPRSVRLCRSWDDEAIIKEIRRMRTQEIPLYARYVMKHYGYVFSRARRQFVSWIEALIAVGIITKEFANKIHSSPLGVLKVLRDVLETSSKDNIPEILRIQAELYFGSLRKAIVALKKHQRLRRGWSKLKIS
jgi:hypothetical protein